jgi:hypothetical protein
VKAIAPHLSARVSLQGESAVATTGPVAHTRIAKG